MCAQGPGRGHEAGRPIHRALRGDTAFGAGGRGGAGVALQQRQAMGVCVCVLCERVAMRQYRTWCRGGSPEAVLVQLAHSHGRVCV